MWWTTDPIWWICFFTNFGILIIGTHMSIIVLQHLYCIPRLSPVSNVHTIYSTLSISFAALCMTVTLSCFPITAVELRPYYKVRAIYSALIVDSYVLSKLFFYIQLILRLFDRHHRTIYDYVQWIQYILWILWSVILLTVIIGNIGILGFHIPEFCIVHVACLFVWLIVDCIMSISTIILFFRPMCSRKIPFTLGVDITVVRKYAMISALQIIVAVTHEIAFTVWMCSEILNYWKMNENQEYLLLLSCAVLQMWDCLLLVIFIYLVFARQQTVCNYVFIQHSDEYLQFPLSCRSEEKIL